MTPFLLAAGGGWQLAWLLAVLFAAYTLRGATGFGASVVAIPLLLLALPVAVVIPLVTTAGMLASLGQGVHQRRHVDWHAFFRLVAPTLVGVGAGLWLFSTLDHKLLLRALALFVVGYAVSRYIPRRRQTAPPHWLAPFAGSLGAFVATVFGGMAGPFYAIYLRSLALDKTQFRATIAVALLGLAALRAAGYGGIGLYDRRLLLLLAIGVPVVVAAMVTGDRWHGRMDERRFGHVIAALLAMSGVALLFK